MSRPIQVLAWPARRNQRENPFNKMLSDATEAGEVAVSEFNLKTAFFGGFDIFHIHWPDALLKHVGVVRQVQRLVALSAMLVWVRWIRSKRTVWTVHNLAPHGGAHPWTVRWLQLLLRVTIDHQVHLTGSTADELKSVAPGLASRPRTVIPHGIYDDLPSLPQPSSARRSLSLNSNDLVLGYVGTITPYKGVPGLLRAFRSWERSSARLLVSGACPESSLGTEVESAAGEDLRIRLDLRWLSDDDLTCVLSACDLMVFPYSRVLNSGSVLLALSAGRPVLVPNTGSMQEIGRVVGPDWMLTYDGVITPQVLEQACSRRPPPGSLPDLSAFGWAGIGEAHRRMYRILVGGEA